MLIDAGQSLVASTSSAYLARRPSFSLEREERGSKERRERRDPSKLEAREGGNLTLCCLTAERRSRMGKKRHESDGCPENLLRIFMEMQISFQPMNVLRKRAKDGNLPFSDRDPFNSGNKRSCCVTMCRSKEV